MPSILLSMQLSAFIINMHETLRTLFWSTCTLIYFSSPDYIEQRHYLHTDGVHSLSVLRIRAARVRRLC
jgi:hypothetical protein